MRRVHDSHCLQHHQSKEHPSDNTGIPPLLPKPLAYGKYIYIYISLSLSLSLKGVGLLSIGFRSHCFKVACGFTKQGQVISRAAVEGCTVFDRCPGKSCFP